MKTPPWDQRIARVLVKPLVKSPVTPNQMTMFTLAVALAGAGLLATGDAVNADWGAGLFVLARFLDHFDGELARQKGMTSRLGYYLDYVSGALSYAALFLCMGFGFIDSPLGPWAIVLGAAVRPRRWFPCSPIWASTSTSTSTITPGTTGTTP